MATQSRKNVQTIKDPCANCFNPDASGPVCTVCRYPKYIPDPAVRYPGIGCSRCLFLDMDHLDNERCNECRSAWPGFIPEAVECRSFALAGT